MQNLKINDEVLKELYNKEKPKTVPTYKLYNIFTTDKEKAENILAIIEKLPKAERLNEFKKQVKINSQDFISNKKDGNLGWIEVQKLEKNIQELGDYAAKLETKLVVEALTPYESNFFTRANDLVELFRRVDNPYVVGMCDIVPPFVQHESIMAYFDKLANKMDHMQIIDGENGSDTHLIPGEGNIPIKEMLYEMKRIGYDKTATLELVTNYINEPRFYAKRAIDNMRELMAEAGIV